MNYVVHATDDNGIQLLPLGSIRECDSILYLVMEMEILN